MLRSPHQAQAHTGQGTDTPAACDPSRYDYGIAIVVPPREQQLLPNYTTVGQTIYCPSDFRHFRCSHNLGRIPEIPGRKLGRSGLENVFFYNRSRCSNKSTKGCSDVWAYFCTHVPCLLFAVFHSRLHDTSLYVCCFTIRSVPPIQYYRRTTRYPATLQPTAHGGAVWSERPTCSASSRRHTS